MSMDKLGNLSICRIKKFTRQLNFDVLTSQVIARYTRFSTFLSRLIIWLPIWRHILDTDIGTTKCRADRNRAPVPARPADVRSHANLRHVTKLQTWHRGSTARK